MLLQVGMWRQVLSVKETPRWRRRWQWRRRRSIPLVPRVRYLLKVLGPLERLWTVWKTEVNISGVTLAYWMFERSMNIYKGKALVVETKLQGADWLGEEREKEREKKISVSNSSSSAALPDRGVLAVGERFPLFVPPFSFQTKAHLSHAGTEWMKPWLLRRRHGDAVRKKTCWCS